MSQHLHKAHGMNPTNLSGFMFENDNIQDITNTLTEGGILLMPTDTIWGIGCDATNSEAIKKVFDLKQRDYSKPLSILVDSIEMIKEYVVEIHPRIETLLMHHTRPLTVIYPEARNLPDNLLPENRSIGIRIVQDAFCQEIIRQLGKPIVSTSANIAGQPFPTHFGEISSAIIQGVDYVVKQRQHDKNNAEPSVIVRIDPGGEMTFIRE